VNPVKNVKGVDVAISLREDKPGRIKFSLRSTGNIDVQLMSADLQGGGHKNASGGTIDADIDTARDRIVEIATSHLAGQVG
jgi:bifunctional oligoribonuclease and PAP phosphatase NrnA